MSRITERKLFDFSIFVGCIIALYYAGAGFWAIPVCLVLSVWSYYDGATRKYLKDEL